MKRIFMSGCLLAAFLVAEAQQPEPADSFFTLSPVEVRAVRASDNAPITRTNISKKEIGKMNLGQDIPFLLNQTPSVVINSDAGNGIGYTGIRIRGTDATRINVTLNGIPYNDAESQGTFFVDLPDFSSSTGSIQIQRGVGSSSNGAGAFGASLNFSTNELNKDAYFELNNSAGSFNSWKNTLRAGTGLIRKFTADLRLSQIRSDGFIDRASSRLRSFFFSTAFHGEKTGLRLNVFSGKEKTYQAWYGISETDLLAGRRRVNYAGTERPGLPYDNETDNYTQTHYQLFFNQTLSKRLQFNTALFLTRGKGYYEQYKANRDFSEYGLPYPVNGNDTVFNSDFVRQLWLDNTYYGNIFSLQYKSPRTQATLGGSLTRYDGNHFGKVIWASAAPISPRKWYDLDALKTDFTVYFKQQTSLRKYWSLYYDLQYRQVKYTIDGFRNNPALQSDSRYHFFNPKAGIVFRKNTWKTYLSYSIARKEPNRDDFEAGAAQKPSPETLHDIELGVEQQKNTFNWSATFYHMRYKDQLVLTGQINDVGAYTRTNIPDSYRAGIELQGSAKICKGFNAAANLAFSQNRVKDFTEYIDDYDNGGQKTNTYASTPIAFSPNLVAGSTLTFIPARHTELSLLGKYVSRQYLDNTGQNSRSLDPYLVQDIRVIFSWTRKKLKEIQVIGQLNNIFNTRYEPNGYTFSYIYGGVSTTENYYFPMAGRNFLVALNIRL